MIEEYDWRRITVVVLAGIAVIYALFWFYTYLTSAKIEVKTNSKDNIVKIVRTSPNESSPLTKQATGNVSFRVKGGTYTVSAYQNGGTYGASKTIAVKARQKVVVTINPVSTVNAEPVYGQAASSAFATKDQLIFLDTTTNTLKQADAAGNITTLFPDYKFRSIKWDSAGDGVAQTLDGKLHYIQNGNISDLLVPFSVNDNAVIGYSISPDGQIYTSNGGVIYHQSAGNFQKIFSAGSAVQLYASDNAVAVISLGQRQGANSLYTITLSGNVNKRPLDVTQAAWSPDGKYLAVNGKGTYTLLNASLQQSTSFSAPQSAAITWLDNNTIAYGIANQLWTYSLTGSQSKQLVLLGSGNNITGIFPGQDHSYVYFSTASATKSQLFRAALKGQRYDKSLNALSSFLPRLNGVCSLNYINFSKPIVLVSYPSLQTTGELCLTAAKGQMRYLNFEPSFFQYNVSPVPVGALIGD